MRHAQIWEVISRFCSLPNHEPATDAALSDSQSCGSICVSAELHWAAWLIIVSAPLMGPIAYGTNLGLLQILGFVLVFIGSVPAALSMLKLRDEQRLVSLSEEAAPTT